MTLEQNLAAFAAAVGGDVKRLTADVATGVVRYVWDGTGTPTRPNAQYVDWLSPVDPSQWMQPGDTWTTTAQL